MKARTVQHVSCLAVSGNVASQLADIDPTSRRELAHLGVTTESIQVDTSNLTDSEKWSKITEAIAEAQGNSDAVIVANDVWEMETPNAVNFGLGRDLQRPVIFVDSQVDLELHGHDPALVRAAMIAKQASPEVLVFMDGSSTYFYRPSAGVVVARQGVVQIEPATLGANGRVNISMGAQKNPNVRPVRRKNKLSLKFGTVETFDATLSAHHLQLLSEAAALSDAQGMVLHADMLVDSHMPGIAWVATAAHRAEVPLLVSESNPVSDVDPKIARTIKGFGSHVTYLAGVTRATATAKMSWALGLGMASGLSFEDGLDKAIHGLLVTDQVGELNGGWLPPLGAAANGPG